MGSPLCQTVYTSVYLDRLLNPTPRSLEEAQFTRFSSSRYSENPLVEILLRAYCIGLIKSCDFVHRRIGASHYYEVSLHGGLPTGQNVIPNS